MKSNHRRRNCRSAIQAMDFHTTHTVVTSYGKCCVHVTAYVAVLRSLSTTYTVVVLSLLLRQYVSYQFGVWAEYKQIFVFPKEGLQPRHVHSHWKVMIEIQMYFVFSKINSVCEGLKKTNRPSYNKSTRAEFYHHILVRDHSMKHPK